MKGCSDRHRTCGIVLLAAALFLSLNLLLPTTSASIRTSLLMQPSVAVTAAPIILQPGTAGTSTIYTNQTSAKASVTTPNSMSWWSNDYEYRRRMKIINNNSTVSIPARFTVNFTIDTQQMVTAGKLRADGNDFRMVWWNSSSNSWLELDRLNATNFNMPSTTIKFGTEGSIGAGNYDDNYYIYYGYGGATNPPANGSNVYFFEDLFNRADSSTVGFGWIEYDGLGAGISDAKILNNQLNLKSDNLDYDTQAYHMLDGLTNRSVWEFEWDFNRTGAETTWSMWMQLGKYSLMSNTSNTAGVSVYLDWTGTGAARGGGASAFEMLRVWNSSSITEIGVLKGHHDMKLDLDLTGGSFTIYIDGNNNGTFDVYQKLASCDCIRFVFERATVSNFATYDFNSTRAYLTIDPKPYISLGSEDTNMIDYVDYDTSNVDASGNKGTHSNFTAQQYGPDSVYDTLTEEYAVGSITCENSAESYSATDQTLHSFSYSLRKGSGNDRLVVVTVSWEDAQASASISSLTFGGTAMTEIANVTVGTGYSEYISLWYLLDSSLPFSSGSYDVAATVSESVTREIYMAVAEYSGVKQTAPDDFKTHANTASGNTAITLTAAANGSVVVAGVGEGGINALTNTNNISNLQEQVLTSSGSALGHDTNVVSGNITVGWNSLDTREGMVGAVWQPASNYMLDLEVQWTNATYAQTNEELCIKTGTTGGEDIKVDVWNGSTWINVFLDLTSNSWNNVSVSSYLTSSTFTVRFKGGTESNDTNQDSWSIDATLLHCWSIKADYDCVLTVVNQVANEWKASLRVYGSSNIGRLSSTRITFHDGTSSDQIVISGGNITQSQGPPYDWLGGTGSKISLSMGNLEASTTGASYVYVYLKILMSNTTTYSLYIITFEIT